MGRGSGLNPQVSATVGVVATFSTSFSGFLTASGSEAFKGAMPMKVQLDARFSTFERNVTKAIAKTLVVAALLLLGYGDGFSPSAGAHFSKCLYATLFSGSEGNGCE